MFLLQRHGQFDFAHTQRLRQAFQTALEFGKRSGACLRLKRFLLMRFPGPFALRVLEGFLLRREPREVLVELAALRIERVALGRERSERLLRFGERTGSALCASREQLPQFALHCADQHILAR